MASVVYFASADVDVGTPIKIGSSRNVSETTAKRLLRGERRWTDYQRAKLAKGAA